MSEDWIEKKSKEFLRYLAEASPEEIREFLKKSHYQEDTGINPDDLNILPPFKDVNFLQPDDGVFENPVLINLAWKKAWEARSCPPDNILFRKIKAKKCKAHLNICRTCRDKIEAQLDLKILVELAERMSDILPKPSTVKPAVTVGQIWSLSRKLDGWGEDNRYFKAPFVLVVDSIKDEADRFKVAQTYADDAFMDEGDVWLGDEFGFAESWNLFVVKSNDLENHWGRVSDVLLDKVRTYAINPQPFIPRHEMIPLFRNMEIDLGRYCSLKSVPAVVTVPIWQEVLKGIKVSIGHTSGRLSSAQDWLLDLTNEGLAEIRQAAHVLFPMPAMRGAMPAYAFRTRGAGATSAKPDIKSHKIEMLKNLAPLLPVAFEPPVGNELRIDFRWIEKPPMAPAVSVSLRGKTIAKENISWEPWDSETPVLVIKNCSISEIEQKKSKSLLRIRYAEQMLCIDILFKKQKTK